jgi:hypothetical protein
MGWIAVLEVIILYLIVMFVLSRLFVPHLGFWKEPLPLQIPGELSRTIVRMRKNHKPPLSFAKAAYSLLSQKYEGSHIFTFFRWDLLFTRDVNVLWSRRGYLPCHQQNLLYRIFLVKSGLFSDEDFRLRHTPIYLQIHQYVQVKIGRKWIDVDLWASQCGIPFGRRANFFTIALIEKHLYGRAKLI